MSRRGRIVLGIGLLVGGGFALAVGITAAFMGLSTLLWPGLANFLIAAVALYEGWDCLTASGEKQAP